jgi:hypothetical protein
MPASDTPKLKLPDRAGKAFGLVARLLRDDPALNRDGVEPQWLTPESADFAAELSASDRVVIRLTPSLGPEEPFAAIGQGRVSYRTPVVVKVELAVPGWLWGNAAAVAAAIAAALAPCSPQARPAFNDRLRAAGIAWIEFGPMPAPAGPLAVGVGQFTLVMFSTR